MTVDGEAIGLGALDDAQTQPIGACFKFFEIERESLSPESISFYTHKIFFLANMSSSSSALSLQPQQKLYLLFTDDYEKPEELSAYDTLIECEQAWRTKLSKYIQRYQRLNPVIKECFLTVPTNRTNMRVLREYVSTVENSDSKSAKTPLFECYRTKGYSSPQANEKVKTPVDVLELIKLCHEKVDDTDKKKVTHVKLELTVLKALTAGQRHTVFYHELARQLRKYDNTLHFNDKYKYVHNERHLIKFLELVDGGELKHDAKLSGAVTEVLFQMIDEETHAYVYKIIGPVAYRPTDIVPLAVEDEEEAEPGKVPPPLVYDAEEEEEILKEAAEEAAAKAAEPVSKKRKA